MDLAAFVDINIFRRRGFGQAGHAHDVAAQGDGKTGTGGHFHGAHMQGEATGGAQLGGIVAKGVLGFGHAHR